jgi:hypothetical protein
LTTLSRPRLAQRNEDVQWLDYIHQNLVVEDIVENEEDYLYSSTRNFAGLKGLIELSKAVVFSKGATSLVV